MDYIIQRSREDFKIQKEDLNMEEALQRSLNNNYRGTGQVYASL